MRSSYIFCLLAMCYIAYAVPECPNGGMKMKIPGLPCYYLCYEIVKGADLKTMDGYSCTGPGVPAGICNGGQCEHKKKYKI
uniref:Putative salivary secreted protein n=1 Tax=Ixodes ricinus TaxID=34613 RepID=A0A090X859_IXORI